MFRDKYTIVNTNKHPSGIEKSSVEPSYGGLYIDNFTGSQVNSRLQLNNFIGNQMFSKRPREEFHDDLPSNASSLSRQSKESAFDRS